MATAEPVTGAPTILTLPVELRKQILRDALLAICSPAPAYALGRSPMVLQLLFAADVPCWQDIYGFWGREPMSRLMRLNHQLAAEAIDVLYGGDFVFEFSNTWNIAAAKIWLDVIGEKKNRVRHIALSTVINLKTLSAPDATPLTRAKKIMISQMEAWTYLRQELPALRTVSVYLGFVETLQGGQPGKDRLTHQVIGMVKLFQGVHKLSIDGDRSFPERKMIVQACLDWAAGVAEAVQICGIFGSTAITHGAIAIK